MRVFQGITLAFAVTLFAVQLPLKNATPHEEEEEYEELEEVEGGATGGASLSALFEHLHNKVVHFPIAFAFGSAVLQVASFVNPQLQLSAKILFTLGAISSPVAYFTGEAQEEEAEKKVSESVVETHETLGLVTTIAYIVIAVLQFVAPAPARWLVILFPILVSITGYWGGLIAHPPR